MADNSKIEWTEATWNCVTGCTEVSPGCDRCYAKTFAERWRGIPGHHFEHGFDLTLRPERLDQPLRWKRPRRIFVNSMSDLFHDGVPDEYIARVFGVMAAAPQHTFQVLTKRHGRMRALLSSPWFLEQIHDNIDGFTVVPPNTYVGNNWPLRNVWLGVSVETQQWADIRVPVLLDTPAAVRWLSCEPLLGPVDLRQAVSDRRYACHACEFGNRGDCNTHRVDRLDWVVAGGESGPGARPMHPDWARSLVEQCRNAGIPAFVKQMGAVWARQNGAASKGGDWGAWPVDLRVRQYPEVANANA